MLRLRFGAQTDGAFGTNLFLKLTACVSMVVLIAVAVSMAGKIAFDGRMLPGVTVGSRNVGGMTVAAAREAIDKLASDYTLRLSIAGENFEATPAQAGIIFDVNATVMSAYDQGRNGWFIPFHKSSLPLSYHMNSTQLNTYVSSLASHIAHPPVDARIAITGTSVRVVPDESGMSIDKSRLERLIESDAALAAPTVLAAQVTKQAADIRAASLGPTVDLAHKLMQTPISLQYEGKFYSPTPAQVGSWLEFQKQPYGLSYRLVPTLNQANIEAYAMQLAKLLDVAAKPERVLVVNGTAKILQQGADGTAIDKKPLVAALANAVLKSGRLNYGILAQTVAYRTNSITLVPLGYPKYIEVNLTTQHLWVWQNGQVVYDSPLTSGATGAGFPTVTGLFHIYYKTTDTHLIGYQYGPLYDYDVFVQYWMPFYSGYGLHDASWRHGNFGGPDYYYGGSHGCVNLPLATAAFLYGWAPVGTPVWVHN